MGVGIITVILVKTCKRMDLRNIFFWRKLYLILKQNDS
jgi:hypothetical protein